MLVDSHCHLNMLDLSTFDGKLENVLLHAKENGVGYFLSVAVTLADHPDLVDIAKQYENVFISTGLHPNENPGEELDITTLQANANHPRVIAIGETGLDYYRQEGNIQWQQTRFKHHIACAKSVKKPLIIHSRQAKEDTLSILQSENAKDIGGVMHCFTEDWEMAKRAMDLNFYISFSGIVTFKNATALQEVAQKMPLERMLIETDCPYLAPVPHRGKPNLPGYVCHVAEFISTLRNEPLSKISEITTQNFFALFRPPV
ncbi:MAG: TatD family hydrolase [Proteobacteria bacterium]|nr:TatD family hydrolase [Pseudomonadota bacterium]